MSFGDLQRPAEAGQRAQHVVVFELRAAEPFESGKVTGWIQLWRGIQTGARLREEVQRLLRGKVPQFPAACAMNSDAVWLPG